MDISFDPIDIFSFINGLTRYFVSPRARIVSLTEEYYIICTVYVTRIKKKPAGAEPSSTCDHERGVTDILRI